MFKVTITTESKRNAYAVAAMAMDLFEIEEKGVLVEDPETRVLASVERIRRDMETLPASHPPTPLDMEISRRRKKAPKKQRGKYAGKSYVLKNGRLPRAQGGKPIGRTVARWIDGRRGPVPYEDIRAYIKKNYAHVDPNTLIGGLVRRGFLKEA